MAQWWRIHLPMQELWIQLLDQEDLLEEEMQPTAVFLPWKSYRQRSLAGTVHGLGGERRVGHKRVRHDLETQQQQLEFSHQPVMTQMSIWPHLWKKALWTSSQSHPLLYRSVKALSCVYPHTPRTLKSFLLWALLVHSRSVKRADNLQNRNS